MTDNTATFADAHADLMDALGIDATVQRGSDAAVPVRVFREQAVATVGDYGKVVGRSDRLSFIKQHWEPARGDIVTITATGLTRKVDSIGEDDGIVVTVVMHG